MIVKSFITLIAIFVIGSLQAQTTYYVDATAGNDTNLGTTQILAWKTIQKVENMSVNFQPGDSILFKKGEVWNGEQLKPSNHPDGTINNPITYASYGAGAKPIINLHIEQSPVWTDEGNDIWSTDLVWVCGSRFFENNVEMLRANDSSYFGLFGTRYYIAPINSSTNKLYIKCNSNPAFNTYQWSEKCAAIEIDNADYINLVNLDIRGAGYAIFMHNNVGWNITNCNLGRNSAAAIKVVYSLDLLIDNCSFVPNNLIDQSQLPDTISGSSYSGCTDGVFVTTGSSDITISNSFFKNWGHASFSSNTTDSLNKVSNIIFHNNELTSPDILYGGRIGYSGYSEDGEYYNNYIHDISVQNQLGGSRNHFHHNIIDGVLDSPLKSDRIGVGIMLQNYNIQVKDNIIENNVIANTDSKGFSIYSINFDYPNEVSGNIFRNNIIYNCGITENNIAIQFHKDQSGQLIYNNIVENNLIFSSNTTQTCLYQYSGVLSDVVTFNTQDADIINNLGGNPLFVDAANGDFHLLVNSPAIDAGVTPLATKDYDGNIIPNGIAADIGAFEYYGPMGITETNTERIVLYPNPTTGKIFISNEFFYERYQVISLTGAVLKSGKIKTNEIDLDELISGIYLIKFIGTGTGKTKFAKLIKK
jgi:hypothetical protein